MKQRIKLTRKNIGRHKVGDVFEASRRDARLFKALGLAVDAEDDQKPAKKKKKKRKYTRRDVKPSEKVVLTPEDNTE